MNLKPQSATSSAVKTGRMIVISGPSGAGKSTVVRKLLTDCSLPLALSVSATTRQPRAGEVHGQDYFFLPADEFDRRRRAGEFLECKEVFGRGDWYGTLQSQVAAGLEAGKWVILEIDVDGMRSVLERYPDTITIFIHSGGIDELERRLRTRNTDSDDAIRRRLEVARHELAYQNHYRHQILNDDVDQSVRQICEILLQLGA
ncbi:Guanylate kinase [Anatilimnocola aggregata]|uniref:Guanylate kinase n=1 Tax=Anatilimnocola aggregata TaxID=2528021 RepID=A0A517YIU9_9BACT|nr:guanylate kinase [Anatilimnocola aggregata]QDU30142.1 Guanylate kinase [Anatilimnocola aggregata]